MSFSDFSCPPPTKYVKLDNIGQVVKSLPFLPQSFSHRLIVVLCALTHTGTAVVLACLCGHVRIIWPNNNLQKLNNGQRGERRNTGKKNFSNQTDLMRIKGRAINRKF